MDLEDAPPWDLADDMLWLPLALSRLACPPRSIPPNASSRPLASGPDRSDFLSCTWADSLPADLSDTPAPDLS